MRTVGPFVEGKQMVLNTAQLIGYHVTHNSRLLFTPASILISVISTIQPAPVFCLTLDCSYNNI